MINLKYLIIIISISSFFSLGGLAQNMTQEGVIRSQTPELKMPQLPPRSSDNTVPRTDGRSSAKSMISIGKGAYPGLMCSLNDNRPHKDLVLAIHNLAKVVVVTPECQNNTELVKMNEEVKRMMEAGSKLVGYWGSPELVVGSSQSLGDFQGSLNVMLEGINKVTVSLQNNGFLNSQCGKNLTTGTGLLTSFSDLVSTFAPFALIGAAMNPSLKVALPYILGITGVGSTAKIISTMQSDQTIDISRPEHRQAILDNLCEFSKISQRVRFLKLAQSGNIDVITEDLQKMNQFGKDILFQEFGKRVFEIKKTQLDLERELNLLLIQNTEMQNKHNELVQDLKTATPQLNCLMTKQLLSQQDPREYPFDIVTHFNNVTSLQIKPLVYQNTLLKTEAAVRLKILNEGLDEASCASSAVTYIQVIDRILLNSRQSLGYLKTSLESQLNEDSDFKAFTLREKNIMSEIEFLSKIKELLEQLNLDNALIDKLELDARMYELKQALLGDPNGLPMLKGLSPAFAWLEFAWGHHLRASHQFSREYGLLLQDVIKASLSENQENYKRDAQGQIQKDKWGNPIRQSPKEQEARLIEKIKESETLNQLNSKIAPEGSETHSLMCRRLETIWLSWTASLDHLSASQFFCNFISPFFDTSTDPKILKRCEGYRDVYGKVHKHSEIGLRLLEIRKENDKQKASLISSKMKELNCPLPPLESLRTTQNQYILD